MARSYKKSDKKEAEPPQKPKYDWGKHPRGVLFIQQYVADNEGSKSNRVRDMTFRLGREIGLWKVEDKKAVNYKIVQMARSYKKIEKKEKNIGYNIKALQQTACLVVNPITKPKYDWGKNPRGMLFIQQYVADNEGSKSNHVRDMTFRLGLEIGLWKVEDKKAVNYKIEQIARSYKKSVKKEAQPPKEDSD